MPSTVYLCPIFHWIAVEVDIDLMKSPDRRCVCQSKRTGRNMEELASDSHKFPRRASMREEWVDSWIPMFRRLLGSAARPGSSLE